MREEINKEIDGIDVIYNKQDEETLKNLFDVSMEDEIRKMTTSIKSREDNIKTPDQIIGDEIQKYLTNCNIKSLDSITTNLDEILLKNREVYGIKPKEIRYKKYYDTSELNVEVQWTNSNGENIYISSIVI